MPQAPPVYKARPLAGIWATPPFLHNGSVPNLYQLLLPADKRDAKFLMGTKDFDAKNVGYVLKPLTDRGFIFDTAIAGNSNRGHEFRGSGGPTALPPTGAACVADAEAQSMVIDAKPMPPSKDGVLGPELTDDQRWAIIEYLKVHRNDPGADEFPGLLSLLGNPAEGPRSEDPGVLRDGTGQSGVIVAISGKVREIDAGPGEAMPGNMLEVLRSGGLTTARSAKSGDRHTTLAVAVLRSFMNRILIIGGTGNIGRQVVTQLTATRAQVRALVRNPDGARLPQQVEVMRGDLTCPDTLDACLAGIDTVFLVWTAPAAAAASRFGADREARAAYRISLCAAQNGAPVLPTAQSVPGAVRRYRADD